MLKIFVLIPEKNVQELINSMADAGCGVLGNYSHNAFVTTGMGNWKSEEGSHPTIGKVGETTTAIECRVEMLCPEEKLQNAIHAIHNVHPYEEPSIDVVQLYQQ